MARATLNKNRANGGFSLVEAIVALSILGFGLAMVLQSVALSSRTAARGQQTMQAAFLIQNLLAVCGTEYQIRPGAFYSGTSDDLQWSIRMEEATGLSGAAALVQAIDIHVEVRWQSGNRERTVRAFTTRTIAVQNS